jgi:S1-C subfamily serine protease
MRAARPAAAAGLAAFLAAGCGAPAPSAEPPRPLRVTVAVDGLVPEVATGVPVGDGRVVTVAHVLSGGRAVAVARRPATVVRVDRRLDLAVLAVPGLRAPRLRVGRAAGRAGIAVLRDRGPRSLRASVRRRVTIRWRDQPGDRPQIRPGLEVAARIDPGDSGAPVLDPRGRLLGVVYARSRDEATAWAVDASAVRSLVAGLSPSARG